MVANISKSKIESILTGFQDHERFCRESLRVRDRAGSLVPMVSWGSQRKLSAAVRKQQKAGKPVRILILKTRRSGFTLGSCSHIFREVMPFSGRTAFVIADKYDPAALEAFSYFKAFTNGYVPFGPAGTRIALPELRINEGDLKIRRGDQVVLDVYSADRGEVRGGGRQWALFDEVAFWRAPELTLRSAMNMVPDLPETGIFIQSTGNGVGGEFYEMCQRAQDPALAEGFAFLFFGWLEDENNRRSFDRPEDAVKFQASLNDEETMLHSMHGATLEQLHWRRWKIRTSMNGRVDDFHQEYPTTPQEAFLTSGRPALDHPSLSRMPVSAGTAGELQEVEQYPKPKILFIPRDHGALTIWRKPELGHQYVIGADPSKGKDVSESKRGDDPDFSVAVVLDRQTGDQVALLRERIRPVPFAEYLSMLARAYNFAFLVPEANDAGFIDALVRTEYPIERMYGRQPDPTDRRPKRIGEIGFETTTLTRSWLVSAIDDAIRTMAITIRSPIVLQECRTFVIKPDGKAEHQTGCHDDCVIASALAVMGLRTAPRALPSSNGRAQIGTYGARKKPSDDDE